MAGPAGLTARPDREISNCTLAPPSLNTGDFRGLTGSPEKTARLSQDSGRLARSLHPLGERLRGVTK
jgi:hypothetical protein